MRPTFKYGYVRSIRKRTLQLSRCSLTWLCVVALLSGGCATTHFDITREIGMFPPNQEEQGDFHVAAKARCVEYDKQNSASSDCIRYYETLLWASDYKSFVGARASLNRNIIWVGGAVALASVGVLTGLAAFGSTSSDAYKIIPIAGTFLAGLLGFSKNDVKYEAYQTAEIKIDQAIRRAKDRVMEPSNTAYREATSTLMREVGSAIDALAQAKLDIVKFQAKSEADQFKEVQQTRDEVGLGKITLKSVSVDQDPNPKKIIVELSDAIDVQKVAAEELRFKIVDSNTGVVETLRIVEIVGAKLKAEIPQSLQDHGEKKTYLVQVQARHGAFTFKEAAQLVLNWTKARLVIKVVGDGTVSITAPALPAGTPNHPCGKNGTCEFSLPLNSAVTLGGQVTAPKTLRTWGIDPKSMGTCADGVAACTIASLTRDMTVTVLFDQ